MEENNVLQYQTEIKIMVDKVSDIDFLKILSSVLIVEMRKVNSETQEK